MDVVYTGHKTMGKLVSVNLCDLCGEKNFRPGNIKRFREINKR